MLYSGNHINQWLNWNDAEPFVFSARYRARQNVVKWWNFLKNFTCFWMRFGLVRSHAMLSLGVLQDALHRAKHSLFSLLSPSHQPDPTLYPAYALAQWSYLWALQEVWWQAMRVIPERSPSCAWSCVWWGWRGLAFLWQFIGFSSATCLKRCAPRYDSPAATHGPPSHVSGGMP